MGVGVVALQRPSLSLGIRNSNPVSACGLRQVHFLSGSGLPFVAPFIPFTETALPHKVGYGLFPSPKPSKERGSRTPFPLSPEPPQPGDQHSHFLSLTRLLQGHRLNFKERGREGGRGGGGLGRAQKDRDTAVLGLCPLHLQATCLCSPFALLFLLPVISWSPRLQVASGLYPPICHP